MFSSSSAAIFVAFSKEHWCCLNWLTSEIASTFDAEICCMTASRSSEQAGGRTQAKFSCTRNDGCENENSAGARTVARGGHCEGGCELDCGEFSAQIVKSAVGCLAALSSRLFV